MITLLAWVALRRLITLLRGEAIPLDYGQLAGDLVRPQRCTPQS